MSEKKDVSEQRKDFHLGEIILPSLLITAMVLSLLYYNRMLGILAAVAGAYLIFRVYDHQIRQKRETRARILELDQGFDEITKNAVFGMPFPMAVLNEKGSFLWYNSFFKNIFAPEGSLLGADFSETFPEFPQEKLSEPSAEPFRVEVSDRILHFYHNVTQRDGKEKLILLYGVDNTEDERDRQLFLEERLSVWEVYVDNFDDVRAKSREKDRPMIFALIDRMLNNYATEHDGFLIRYEQGRYLLVMPRRSFDRSVSEKFPIIEAVRDIDPEKLVIPTLSIGIAYGHKSPEALHEEARQAIDIALSRGGDQVVMKDGEEIEYFGGKSQATQRYTKVKARVIANAIHQFIDEADQVFIMGHQNPDMDSLGSCLGMLTLVNQRARKGYIVLDEVSQAVRNLHEKALKELPDLENQIYTPRQAMVSITPHTLIIVLDNHRQHSTPAPELFEEERRVIIVDHHRRGKGYLSDAVISYIEPYASSTAEMVTELLSYGDEEMNIPQVVAEGLLAGITVDTKNFFYQTGTRTFEAAALLKRQGADSIVIKQLFKDDFELVQYKSEIVTEAKPYKDHVLISRFEHDMDGSTLIASQAADDLLNVRGVEASFVLTYQKGRVHISARSLGGISVQLIMERIGGGGHLTAAATQMDVTIDEAEKMLKRAVDEYMEEEQINESDFA